jgi:hypothetical protein
MQQHEREWRRSKVLELSSQDYSHRELARKLQVDFAVNRDIQFLRRQAQENLQWYINEVVPEEYQRCMTGIKHKPKTNTGKSGNCFRLQDQATS